MARDPPDYGAPDGVVVVLISEAVNGSPERRLAARFLLDCLRRGCTKQELATRLDRLEEQALLDVVDAARKLASGLNLLT
jgi:hypothetical protein